jgi:hypothetical protein
MTVKGALRRGGFVQQHRLAGLDLRQRVFSQRLLLSHRYRQPVTDVAVKQARRFCCDVTSQFPEHALVLEIVEIPVDGDQADVE